MGGDDEDPLRAGGEALVFYGDLSDEITAEKNFEGIF